MLYASKSRRRVEPERATRDDGGGAVDADDGATVGEERGRVGGRREVGEEGQRGSGVRRQVGASSPGSTGRGISPRRRRTGMGEDSAIEMRRQGSRTM